MSRTFPLGCPKAMCVFFMLFRAVFRHQFWSTAFIPTSSLWCEVQQMALQVNLIMRNAAISAGEEGGLYLAIKDHAESRLNAWPLPDLLFRVRHIWVKWIFETCINSLTVLHCSCPSKNVRRILAGGRACHSAFGATSRCDFLQCRYQCMWERTSLAKRQAFQHVWVMSFYKVFSLADGKWNHKLQSISICMSLLAQNLASSNVHSCQCQNCLLLSGVQVFAGWD